MTLARNPEGTESGPSPILDLLAKRRSPYAFSPRWVEPEKLRRLFQAARWAPSSYNEQPWRFILTTRENPGEYLTLLGTLVESNQQWAQQAPVLVLAVAKLAFEKDGSANRHSFYDVGQAVAHLTVQATAEGLFVHQMGGFDVERARQLFHIGEGYEPVTVIAIGYLGDSESAGPGRPRVRKPLEAVVFGGIWGQPSPL
jgi:nitroreductase